MRYTVSSPEIVIGVDVGGTFIDIVAIEKGGSVVRSEKVLSTPEDLSAGILYGLEKMFGLQLDAKLPGSRIVHATTSATNALIEKRTSRVGLITNRGFRDVLEIRRHARSDTYNLDLQIAPPLVPRNLRMEIDARIAPDGTIMEPINRKQVIEIVQAMIEASVEVYTVSLLHAYARPQEEHSVAEIIRLEDPEAYVTCSVDVCPEFREYERTSTAVVNAAVMPLVDAYLGNLENRLKTHGYDRQLYIMQSSGGMMTASEIRSQPINIIESGPAAGVVSSHAIGRVLGRKNLLSFDMGGTTAKAALIHEGRIEMSTEYEVGGNTHGAQGASGYGAGYPIRGSFMDIVEVGAGGGSIAWIDDAGGLRVGPQSAGADPGPVCYARGGKDPTTTDANLYLGRLSADYFLGGEMALDLPKVEEALSRLAVVLGMDALKLAAGIIEVSNSHMVRALRRVSIERGRHPSLYSMVAFGGAGPIHACYLAEELGVTEVIVPPMPGVASAVGLIGADMRHEARKAFFGKLSKIPAKTFQQTFEELSKQACITLEEAGILETQFVITGSSDMRYVGQAYELTVDWPTLTPDDNTLIDMATNFHGEHFRHYSYDIQDRDIELVSLRVTVTASVDRPPEIRLKSNQSVPKAKTQRRVHFRDAVSINCAVYERNDIHADAKLEGPIVIEQKDSTTLVPPNWSLTADPSGHLILNFRE